MKDRSRTYHRMRLREQNMAGLRARHKSWINKSWISAPHNIYPLIKRPVRHEMIWDIISWWVVEVLTFYSLNWKWRRTKTWRVKLKSFRRKSESFERDCRWGERIMEKMEWYKKRREYNMDVRVFRHETLDWEPDRICGWEATWSDWRRES